MCCVLKPEFTFWMMPICCMILVFWRLQRRTRNVNLICRGWRQGWQFGYRQRHKADSNHCRRVCPSPSIYWHIWKIMPSLVNTKGNIDSGEERTSTYWVVMRAHRHWERSQYIRSLLHCIKYIVYKVYWVKSISEFSQYIRPPNIVCRHIGTQELLGRGISLGS